jgi:hypothetical protein
MGRRSVATVEVEENDSDVLMCPGCFATNQATDRTCRNCKEALK